MPPSSQQATLWVHGFPYFILKTTVMKAKQ